MAKKKAKKKRKPKKVKSKVKAKKKVKTFKRVKPKTAKSVKSLGNIKMVKAVRKPVRVAKPMMKTKPVRPMRAMKIGRVRKAKLAKKHPSYLLALSGGLVVFIAAVLAAIIPQWEVSTGMTIASIVCGLVIIAMTTFISRSPKASGILILLFSIAAIIIRPYGLFFGPILSLIGSLILLIRK